MVDGHYKYVRDASEIHAIFGFLQVNELFGSTSTLPIELSHHPHATGKYLKDKRSCIYTANENLSFESSVKGAGFLNFHQGLVLTKQKHSKSRWLLPEFFKNLEISHHSQDSFRDDYFQSISKGQEIVIEANDELLNWTHSLIKCGQ